MCSLLNLTGNLSMHLQLILLNPMLIIPRVPSNDGNSRLLNQLIQGSMLHKLLLNLQITHPMEDLQIFLLEIFLLKS